MVSNNSTLENNARSFNNCKRKNNQKVMSMKIIHLLGDDTWHPCSPEFINYALALVVYSVRYPAVFWNTNKAFSFMFSAQVIITNV